MPRPTKNTVDYFPHDAHASEGRTLTILFNHFGHEGYSAWFQLLERVSVTETHVIDIRNSENIDFLAAKLHLLPERMMVILSKMADLGAIDKSLFLSGQIWCQHLIDRLAFIYDKRKQQPPTKPELSMTETPVSVTETPVSVTESTPIKEKKIKEKKIKDNIPLLNISTKQGKPTSSKQKYGEFQNVTLTSEERKKLTERFGERSAEERIERLSEWLESSGKTKKSHYATILTWARNDATKGHDNGKTNTTGRASSEEAQPAAVGRISPFAKYRGNTGGNDEEGTEGEHVATGQSA